MIATEKFVQDCFDRFNILCFNGELPQIPIEMGRARKCLGKFHFCVRRKFLGKKEYYGFKIIITKAVDIPETELEDIVIHEMIHYYIAHKNINDSSPHGTVFKAIMNSINQKFGRHISIRYRINPDADCLAVDDLNTSCNKTYLLIVTTFSEGQCGVTVCAKSKVFELYRLIPRYYKTKKMELFLSNDPFFDRYPRSNTPKIYKITQADLQSHLPGALSLELVRNVIRPKSH